MSSNQMHLGFNVNGIHGTDTFRPYAHGDIIVDTKGRRHVVTTADTNNDGVVLCTIALDNGAECVVLEREIAYRTSKA